MQPLPDARAHAALSAATAFVRAVVVTFTRGETSVAVEPDSGSWGQDGRRSMRWSGEVAVASQQLLPNGPADLLTPFGTRAAVDLGITLSDGTTSQVPFGRYIVDAASVEITPDSRSVTLPLVDLADAVAKYRFEEPFDVPAGVDVAEAVNLVVEDRTGTNPGVDDTGSTLARARIFGLDPETDPWRELGDLVAGFGMRLWYDRSGNLVLDTEPTPDGDDAVPLVGPLTVTGSWEQRPPNVVVARGEPSDDTPPVQAVALDDDPSSPTYAGTGPGNSPYGRITRFYASPLITDTGQAQAAARSILAGTAGAGAAWTVSRPFDPTWDPDDVITVDRLGEPLTLVVDAVTVDQGGETVMECRAPSTLSGGE